MKMKMIFYATLAAIAFAGCRKNDNKSSADGETALSVTGGIQTRAYDNKWEANDAIGIYMLNNTAIEKANKHYTTAGGNTGTFAPATTPADQTIYFPVDGTTRDFVAYYPYANIGSNNLYTVNVATQTSQKAIDLMAAAKVTGKSKTDPAVAFVFEHKLVKLEITIKGDGVSITDAELANTVVKITNQQTAGTYNVVDGGAVSVTSGSAAEITLLTTALKAEGIVLPNTNTDGMKLTFAAPAPINQTFEWTIKDAPLSQKFEAGKKYKYTITIAKVGVSVTATITDWTPGNGEGESGNAEME